MRTTISTMILVGLLAWASGCGTNPADDLADANLVDDADAKADINSSSSIRGKWENYDNSGDLEIQYLHVAVTKFDAERWNIDYCPDDAEDSTCSEGFMGTFTLKKTSAGKKVVVLDEGDSTTTRYYYEITGSTLKLKAAGETTWTQLTRLEN